MFDHLLTLGFGCEKNALKSQKVRSQIPFPVCRYRSALRRICGVRFNVFLCLTSRAANLSTAPSLHAVITSNSISRRVNWSGKWSALFQRLMGKENLQICLFYPLFFLVPSSLLSLLSTPDALIFVFLSFIHLAQTAVSNWSRDIPGMPGHLCFVWESVHTPSTPRVEEDQCCSDYWEREGERGWEGEKKIDTSEMKERNKGEKKTGLVLI